MVGLCHWHASPVLSSRLLETQSRPDPLRLGFPGSQISCSCDLLASQPDLPAPSPTYARGVAWQSALTALKSEHAACRHTPACHLCPVTDLPTEIIPYSIHVSQKLTQLQRASQEAAQPAEQVGRRCVRGRGWHINNPKVCSAGCCSRLQGVRASVLWGVLGRCVTG